MKGLGLEQTNWTEERGWVMLGVKELAKRAQAQSDAQPQVQWGEEPQAQLEQLVMVIWVVMEPLQVKGL